MALALAEALKHKFICGSLSSSSCCCCISTSSRINSWFRFQTFILRTFVLVKLGMFCKDVSLNISTNANLFKSTHNSSHSSGKSNIIATVAVQKLELLVAMLEIVMVAINREQDQKLLVLELSNPCHQLEPLIIDNHGSKKKYV